MHICNTSLTEGVFPDSLKMVNVIPLYKSDDSMCFNQYMPACLLCILSKVFEKIIYDGLSNFVNKKTRSTYMVLLSLVCNLTQALENGEYIVGVYSDFSKAFDMLDHMISLVRRSMYIFILG